MRDAFYIAGELSQGANFHFWHSPGGIVVFNNNNNNNSVILKIPTHKMNKKKPTNSILQSSEDRFKIIAASGSIREAIDWRRENKF